MTKKSLIVNHYEVNSKLQTILLMSIYVDCRQEARCICGDT